jgi:hypothetical protein
MASERSSTTPVEVLTASPATVESEPSIRISTVAGVVVGDAERDADVAGADVVIHLGGGERVAVDGEDVGGGEALDQGAALLGVRFVEHDGGNLAHVGVDGEAEEEQLNHGEQQGEGKRAAVADDVQELLAADGDEATEEVVHLLSAMIL